MLVNITLDTLTAHHNGHGGGAAEPFLWPVFFKVDEFTVKSVVCGMRERGENVGLADFLAPDAWCRNQNWIMRRSWIHGPDGSHGNLPEMHDGDTVDIPGYLGDWQTSLEFEEMAGFNMAGNLLVGCIAVLLEEDDIPSDEEIQVSYHHFENEVRLRIERMVEATIRQAGTPVGNMYAYLREPTATKHVMYRGNDGHIHELYLDLWEEEKTWRHHDLTLSMRAQAACDDASGDPWAFSWRDQHAFFQGNDDRLREFHYEYDREGNRWRENIIHLFSYDKNDIPEPPVAAGRVIAYPWDDNDSKHVFYRSADGHIHELSWKPRRIRGGKSEHATWKHFDLTEETDAPLADGDPSGYIWADDESHRIFYRGENNHIYELRKSHGEDWVYLDLSERADAPEAAGNVSAYVWSDDETQHVFYRGVDRHIHELHWARGRRGSNWRHNDVSEAAGGAPDAAGDPSAYVWQDDESQHVFYRGSDHHIHELHWKAGREGPNWRHNDLTEKTDAPEAVANPSAFVWSDRESQHVYYLDLENHVRELNWLRSREDPKWRDYDISEQAGLTGNEEEEDPFTPSALEAEIARKIEDELPDFFAVDDLIGVGVWFWRILDLRDHADPSSGRYVDEFSRPWNQTSGSRRGIFPDDWEINGTIRVSGTRA